MDEGIGQFYFRLIKIVFVLQYNMAANLPRRF